MITFGQTLFLLSWITIVNCGCIKSDVSMYHQNELIPNNSYVLFSSVQRVNMAIYCNTSNPNCCSAAGDWYLPNGERILGGYEYSNITNRFLRSSNQQLHNIGLYRHRSSNPPERGRLWCVVPDTNGTNCTQYVNIVSGIPAVVDQSVSQVANTGDNVTYSVNVLNNDFATYQWQKVTEGINDDDLGKYHGTRSPMLTIINVQEEDEGFYRCVIDDYLVSYPAELSVGKSISMQESCYYCSKTLSKIIIMIMIIQCHAYTLNWGEAYQHASELV